MSHVLVHSQIVSSSLGIALSGWLPLGVVAAAAWSRHCRHRRLAPLVLVAASWPLWVLGVALVDFGYGLSLRPESGSILEAFVASARRLDTAVIPLLATAAGGAAILGWRAHPERRWVWRALSGAVLLGGAFAFAATRAHAHDAEASLTVSESELWGEFMPKTRALPEGLACRPPAKDAMDVRIAQENGGGGWNTQTTAGVIELAKRQLSFSGGRPVTLRIAIEPGVEAGRLFEQLRELAAEHPNLEAELLYGMPLPAVQSRTLGRAIPRMRPCVVPIPLR